MKEKVQSVTKNVTKLCYSQEGIIEKNFEREYKKL